MTAVLTSHISSDNPRVLVVDGSKVARKLIEQVLKAELPNATVTACETGAEAKMAMESGIVDLVTTALHLHDMDGLEVARHVREHSPQAYIPIIVVSGDVQERLETRSISDDVTDYFDKSLGFQALAAFIKGYVAPESEPGGEVLYVEDSRVVAVATRAAAPFAGLPEGRLEVGARADLVLVDAENAMDALVRTPPREVVIAGGRLLVG